VILGIGTDIIEIERIELAFKKHGAAFFERLFTEKERTYCNTYAHPIAHFAGRFAAKEAIVKALGTGFTADVQWQDIEIINDRLGKPVVTFHRKLCELYKGKEVLLSISHCKSYATATAVVK
jgi:holo-[acyl-carrier protein] synthase